MARLKLKALESYLQDVRKFENPKIKWEQYVTSPHIAAQMLYCIQTNFQDVEEKIIADLGCGCGVLSIGCVALGSAYVMGFEIDPDALEVFSDNVQSYEIDNIDSVLCDVRHLPIRWHKKFDSVIMNPPFGTKHQHGIDLICVQEAFNLASKSVYSLHKTSTRKYVMQKAISWGSTPKVVAELSYDLPASYNFHKKHSVDVHVDLIQFNLLQP